MSKRSKNIGCFPTLIFIFVLYCAIETNSPLLAGFSVICYFIYLLPVFLNKKHPLKNSSDFDEDEGEDNIRLTAVVPEVNEAELKNRLSDMAKIRNSKEIAFVPMPSAFVQKEKWEITLITTSSKSIMLPPFLEIVKQYPTYKEYIENNIQYYEVSFPYQYINDFKKVYEMVKTLRGTRVYICGDLMEKKELAQLLICAGDKNISPIKDFCYGVSPYTYNPFGCHRIQIHSMGDKAWFTFAYYKNGKVLIDKDKILKYMLVNLKRYKYCPFMNLQEIWNNFLRLPNEISLYDENFAIIKTFNGGIEVSSRWRFYDYIDYETLKTMYGNRLLSRR